MHKQLQIAFATIAFSALLHSAMTQRPSFAGSRPVDGHNQKDKYNTPQTPDIVNRFGEADGSAPAATNIPFGEPQRPPQGLPVVSPQPVYVPLPSTVQAPAPVPQFAINNRLGDLDTGSSGAAAAADSTAASLPSPPLDAHGDHLLLDQLSRLPEDNRPFWFLNYQAIEAQRNGTAPSLGGPISSRGSFFGRK